MSALPKNVKDPHFRAQRNHNKTRVLIPAKDGTLEVQEFAPDIYHRKKIEKEGSRPRYKRVPDKRVKRAGQRLDAATLKALDLVAFNTKAEEFFVFWLSEKIAGAAGQGVAVSWVFPNAAYELDVSIETAKRYLSKHTADMAEFEVLGGMVHIRD